MDNSKKKDKRRQRDNLRAQRKRGKYYVPAHLSDSECSVHSEDSDEPEDASLSNKKPRSTYTAGGSDDQLSSHSTSTLPDDQLSSHSTSTLPGHETENSSSDEANNADNTSDDEPVQPVNPIIEEPVVLDLPHAEAAVESGASDSTDEESDDGSQVSDPEDYAASENTEHDEHEGSEASFSSVSENEDEDFDDDAGNEEGNIPLYPGAPLTLHKSLLSIFTLATVKRVTGKLLAKILLLIFLHCPLNNNCKKTLFKFKKYFAIIGKSIVKFHYFCSNCVYPVPSKASECLKCHNTGTSFFLEIPLMSQLQVLFKRPNFFEDLQYRFSPTRKKNIDNIEDIFDGDVYKEEMRNGFLRNPHHISFFAYSDGISIFKSSSFSVWPLSLVVNELTYKKRTQPNNIILAGLWFGKIKPCHNVFLKPLKESFDFFTTTGYNWQLHDRTNITVKGKILCFNGDLPAKSTFLKFKQFNGSHGCAHCLAPGEEHATGPRSRVRVYPYSAHVEMRTHDQTREFAQRAIVARATDRKASVNGVKGLSILFYLLPGFIKCLAIDIMHGVFLGICKSLISLWFSSAYSRLPWTLYDHIEEVDARLRSIKVPSYVQRFPRSVEDVAKWKASEFKLFLMYLSLPVLKGIVNNDYLIHLSKLVSGISLSQESVSNAQLQIASDLLNSFVADFQRLYHIRFMTINLHLLTHLSFVVRNLGPLWVYNYCFFLESFNGEIDRLVHGTQHVALQICTSATMLMQMPVMIDNLPPESVVRGFCRLQLSKSNSKANKIADVIGDGLYAVGTYQFNAHARQDSAVLLRAKFGFRYGVASVFHRLKKNGILYFCTEYSRPSIRKDSTFVSNNVPCLGRLIRFIKWSNCGAQCPQMCRACETNYFFVAQIYERDFWIQHDIPDVRLPYLNKVTKTNAIEVFELNCLNSLCFYLSISGSDFILSPINTLEVE